jgi:hypothetical protein
MIGTSQPHMHNVLNGVRNLSIGMSDSILNSFHISILDLASDEDLANNLRLRTLLEPALEVPFLDTPIGPGTAWPNKIDRRRRYATPFLTGIVPPALVMARLAPDDQMEVTIGGYDMALLDTSVPQRTKPTPEGLYAVERDGEVVLRYLRPGSRGYYVLTDAAIESPDQWEHLNISRRDLPDLIKARVLWLGHEKNRKMPMHQSGRFLYEMISS